MLYKVFSVRKEKEGEAMKTSIENRITSIQIQFFSFFSSFTTEYAHFVILFSVYTRSSHLLSNRYKILNATPSD